MTWRDHATADELGRIEELKMQRQDATDEIKQIYERCRKRMSQKQKTTEKIIGK